MHGGPQVIEKSDTIYIITYRLPLITHRDPVTGQLSFQWLSMLSDTKRREMDNTKVMRSMSRYTQTQMAILAKANARALLLSSVLCTTYQLFPAPVCLNPPHQDRDTYRVLRNPKQHRHATYVIENLRELRSQCNVCYVGGLGIDVPEDQRDQVTGLLSSPPPSDRARSPCLCSRSCGRRVCARSTESLVPFSSFACERVLRRAMARYVAFLRSRLRPLRPHSQSCLCQALPHARACVSSPVFSPCKCAPSQLPTPRNRSTPPVPSGERAKRSRGRRRW